MDRSKSVLTVLLLLVILTGSYFLFDTNDTEHKNFRSFAWYYPEYAEDQNEVLNSASSNGFTDLFVSTNGRRLNDNHSSFDPIYDQSVFELTNNSTIDITFMILQDPIFYNDTSSAIVHLQGIESHIRRHNNNIVGIHFDIEPQADDIWDNESNQQEIFIDFLDTLVELGEYISQSNILNELEVSIAVSWWFNEKGFDARYPDILSQYYSFLVFMVYGGIGDNIEDYSRVEDELESINGVVGYGYSEFGTISKTFEFRSKLEDNFESDEAVIGSSLYKLSDLLT